MSVRYDESAGRSCRPTLSGLAGAFTSHPRPASAKNTHAPSAAERRAALSARRRATPRCAGRCDTPAAPAPRARTARGGPAAPRPRCTCPRRCPPTLRKSKPGIVPGAVDRESPLEGQGIAAQPSARHEAHVQLRVRREAVVSPRVDEDAVVSRRPRAGQARIRRRRRRPRRSSRRRARSRPADTIRRADAARRSACRRAA